MRLGFAVLLALAVTSAPAFAQTRAITIDDLYNPQKKIDFGGGAPAGLTWISDTEYLWPRPAGGGVEWAKVEAASGTATPLFEAKAASDRAAEALGLDSAVVGRALASRGLEMNPARTAAVVAIDNDCITSRSTRRAGPSGSPRRWRRRRSSPSARTASGSASSAATTSTWWTSTTGASAGSPPTAARSSERQARLGLPGGDLRPRQLPRLLVEPDLAPLAFLQLDERPVPEFTVVDHIPRRLAVETWDYPKAGDPNPSVRLGVVGVPAAPGLGQSRSLPPGAAPRRQRRLDAGRRRVVYRSRTASRPGSTWTRPALEPATAMKLFRETTKAWVEDNGEPAWLEGRLVRVGQRAHRVEAPLSLPRRRHAGPADHHRRMGRPHASTASTRPPASPISRAPNAVTSAATSIASSWMAPG